MAYDFGVRELWMVNVGDIATQEFPLSFFLDMAYDFDRWGSRALNCTQEYTRKWVRQQFGSVEEETQDTQEETMDIVEMDNIRIILLDFFQKFPGDSF